MIFLNSQSMDLNRVLHGYLHYLNTLYGQCVVNEHSYLREWTMGHS